MPTTVFEPVDVRFPLAGVARLQGFQAQEPFSCPDALNVRPADVFERRLRGGSRPGLEKAFATDAGTGAPVRLLNSVLTGQENPQQSSFEDPFSGAALQSGWSLWNQTTTPSSPSPSLPSVQSGRAILDASASNNQHVGAIRDLVSFNANAQIEIETALWTSDGMTNLHSTANTVGQRWAIALGLTGDTDYAAGAVVSFQNDGSGNLKVAIYNQGSTVFSSSTGFSVTGNVVRFVYIPGGTLQLYMGSANNLVATVTGVSLLTGRAAMQAWHPTGATRDAGFEYFNFRYTPLATSTPIAEPALVKSVSGSLYYESATGTMTEVTGQSMDLADDRLLASAERFGKLYIADYEVRIEGTDGVLSGNGVTFDSATAQAGASDWTSWGIDTDGDHIELFSGGSTSGTAYTPGIYAISSLGAGVSLTIEDAITGSGSATAVPFRVVRSAKVFDYRLSGSAKLAKLTKNSGSTINPPIGCTLIAVWLDRLCLSGDPENPGDTFMSKQGDPTWWQEDENSDLSAVFGEFDTNTRIDQPVKALIPFSLDYLVFGAADSIHVLRGNPVRGGTVDAITRSVGVIDKFAWCITPEGLLVVLTGDGLYLIDAMAQSAVPLSRDRLPKDFADFDTTNNDIQLQFDVRRNGIVVAVTPKTAGTPGFYYWFDWQTKSFWPESYLSDHQPTAMTSYFQAGESTPTLVFGGRDGYVREHLESAATDDGTNFASFVLIGPIQLGGGGYFDGALREVMGQLSMVSGTVKAEVQVGDSIESAYRATPRDPYILRAGKGLSWYPRLRGNACFIRLSSDGGSPWALEQLTIVRERYGRQRLLA